MGMILVAFGVALLAVGVWSRFSAAKFRAGKLAWPATRGSIDSSAVTVERDNEDRTSTHRFTARYTYVTDGTPQRGYVYSDKTKKHKELLAKYPAGTPVEVFYDPAKPDRSEIRDPLVLAGGGVADLYRMGFVLIPGGMIVAVAGLVFVVLK